MQLGFPNVALLVPVLVANLALCRADASPADITYATPPPQYFDAAPSAQATVLLVQYREVDADRRSQIEELDGVASAKLLLNSIYKVELDDLSQARDVKAALADLGDITSLSDDEPRRVGGANVSGFATPFGSSGALSKQAVVSRAISANTVVPNDPLFPEQWHHESNGQQSADIDRDLNSTQGWNVTTGSSQSIIAVISTGIDYTHEDLAGKVWQNPGEIPNNRIDDDQNGYVDDVHGVNTSRNSGDPMDEDGMGTALAGIIGAETNNNKGVAGISWESRILACNFTFRSGGFSYYRYSDLLECLDYVIRIKKKTNANINTVLFTEVEPFMKFLFREAAETLEDLGVLLVVAGPYRDPPPLIDVIPGYPISFDLSNIVGVEPITRSADLFLNGVGFSGGWVGQRSIHSMAFGEGILTTYPGFDPDFGAGDYYFESFEPGTAWQLDPTWTLSTADSFDGSQSLAMILDTEDFGTEYATSPLLDLSAYEGQPIGVTIKIKMPANKTIYNTFLSDKTYVKVQFGWPGLFNWYSLKGVSSEHNDWQTLYFEFDPGLWSVIPDASAMQFRIEARRWRPEPQNIFIDSFAIGRVPWVAPSNRYVNYNGPVAAAAVVAGVAELVKAANPGFSPAEVRNTLMSTGFEAATNLDESPFANRAMNNTAVRLIDTAGRGALNCSGQGFMWRTWPKMNYEEMAATGQDLVIRTLSTDCAGPGPAPVYQSAGVGGTVISSDDGTGHDPRANDGDFVGTWSSDQPGVTELTLPDDHKLTLRSLDSYDQITEIPFEWRDTSQATNNGIPLLDTPPFPLKLGNLPTGLMTPVLSFSAWGRIEFRHIYPLADDPNSGTFPNHRGTLSEYAIPAGKDSFLISVIGAPGLDDRVFATGAFAWRTVQGTAPNREWIFEFRDVTFRDCPADQNLKAQLVFFENSSDIQFNIAEYGPACGDPNKWPVLGIQYNDLAFTRYEGPFQDEMSLVFSASGDNSNNAPVANTDTIKQRGEHGTPIVIDLDDYFFDPDGDPLSYFLTDKPDSIEINGSILTANLDYDDVDFFPLVEQPLYASDGQLAAKVNLQLSFITKTNFPPRPIGPLPVPTFYRNESAHFPLADLIFDPEGDEITWLTQSVPFGFSLWQNGDLIGVGNPPVPDGINEISFKVTDGYYTNKIKMQVNIQPDRANLPPEVITAIGNVDAEVGKVFRVPLYKHFRDPNGDTVLYSFFVAPAPVPAQFHSFPKLLGGVPDASWLAGSPHTISLRVRDPSGAFIVHDFTITVTDPQGSPATAVAPAPTAVAIDEITVTASSEKKAGGGSTDTWLLAALLLLALVAVRRRTLVVGVEVTIAQQRLPADHLH